MQGGYFLEVLRPIKISIESLHALPPNKLSKTFHRSRYDAKPHILLGVTRLFVPGKLRVFKEMSGRLLIEGTLI
jgi:hypothetical protein